MTVAAPELPRTTCDVVADVAPDTWDAYVTAHPDATGYHLWAWRGVIERAFGHEARYLAATRDGRIAGVLPLVVFRSRLFGRFVVSLPFLNYGGLLADDGEAADTLVAAAIEEARRAGARSVELRHTTRQCPGWHAKEHKVAMRLPLRVTADEQWTVLDRKVRNQVRKAEKSGLTSRQGGPELLDAFYDIFARNMRDLGTPVYTRRFFEEVLRAFPEASRVFTVWKDDQPAAASIVYRWRGTMEVPWASSLREFNPLCANIALYWDMLRDAVVRGCTVFDFGRSTPNEGTYNFKKQWGAEPVPLVWEYWVAEGSAVPDLSPKNAKYQAAISLWQKLPVGLTRVIGPPIVRNIP